MRDAEAILPEYCSPRFDPHRPAIFLRQDWAEAPALSFRDPRPFISNGSLKGQNDVMKSCLFGNSKWKISQVNL